MSANQPEKGSHFRRILLPTDASHKSARATETALDLASALGSSITGLYIVDSSAFASVAGGLELESIKHHVSQESHEVLNAFKAACAARSVACDVLIREGQPAHEIVAAAKGFDLIVMGTHGRTGIDHILWGSITEKVIRQAVCPVVVVRDVR